MNYKQTSLLEELVLVFRMTITVMAILLFPAKRLSFCFGPYLHAR